MKIILLMFVLLVTTGCNLTWRDNWAADARYAAIIAAQTRRTQLITQTVILERMHQRTIATDTRAIIQSQINRNRFEIEQLNAIIER